MPTPDTEAPLDAAELLAEAMCDYVAASIAGLLPAGNKAPVKTMARFQTQWLEQNGYKIVRGGAGCPCPCSVEFPD